jgi:hypothetical protein
VPLRVVVVFPAVPIVIAHVPELLEPMLIAPVVRVAVVFEPMFNVPVVCADAKDKAPVVKFEPIVIFVASPVESIEDDCNDAIVSFPCAVG